MKPPQIIATHPGKSSYYDKTHWVPIPCDSGGMGVWIKPGQAIAIVDALPPATEPAADAPSPTSLLSAGERKVMDGIVLAWNAWVELERLHPDESDEFRHAVHALQKIVMARPVQREFNAEQAKPQTGNKE